MVSLSRTASHPVTPKTFAAQLWASGYNLASAAVLHMFAHRFKRAVARRLTFSALRTSSGASLVTASASASASGSGASPSCSSTSAVGSSFTGYGSSLSSDDKRSNASCRRLALLLELLASRANSVRSRTWSSMLSLSSWKPPLIFSACSSGTRYRSKGRSYPVRATSASVAV